MSKPKLNPEQLRARAAARQLKTLEKRAQKAQDEFLAAKLYYVRKAADSHNTSYYGDVLDAYYGAPSTIARAKAQKVAEANAISRTIRAVSASRTIVKPTMQEWLAWATDTPPSAEVLAYMNSKHTPPAEDAPEAYIFNPTKEK